MISGSFFGKYKGIVQDIQDPQNEQPPHNVGKITVTVPTVTGDEPVVARPALPYGYFFVPTPQAHVWIEYEGGDSGLPLWTGMQNAQPADFATEAAISPPEKRVIKTAAGHLIVFDDRSGQESIEIKDGVNNHDVMLDSKGIVIADGKNKHNLTLDSSGIVIADGKNKHTLKLDSSGIVITDGKNSNKITLAQSGVSIEGGSATQGAKITFDSSGITIDAGSGMVTLKGMKINLGAAASMPILRATIDMGIGNMGAPVTTPPGQTVVFA